MQTVEEAIKALWDYINNLPADQKEKAIKYQQGLEDEAAKTEGGMMQVVENRLQHNSMLLLENVDEVRHIFAAAITNKIISNYRN